MRVWHTLTFRVLAGSCVLLFTLFGLYSYFAIRLHTGQMMVHVLDSAARFSDVIRNSTRYSMLLNRRGDVYQIISTIAREPGVEGIRIYNKRGEIMFSTAKGEGGTVVDMHAEACYACHNSAEPLRSLPAGSRSRIYTTPRQTRVVGLINPIRNERSCSEASCHAHPGGTTVLGVLDVRMSLEQVDAGIAAARRRLILYGAVMAVTVAIGSGLFLFFAVHRPVKILIEGTRQVSSGNLEHRISISARDDLGQLAGSFNEMTRNLERVEAENRHWSETLERRVEEKTLELKRAHLQILQVEKMASLGKLSATVAHELNNPLEGILTYGKVMAKRLRRCENPPDAVKQTIEELDLVIHEVQRCGNIVRNLLLFSRKQVGEMGPVPIESVVRRVVSLMQHHFRISNVRFELIAERAGYHSDVLREPDPAGARGAVRKRGGGDA